MTKIAPKNDPTQKKGQFSCKRLWILAIFMFVLGGFCATKLSTFVVDTLQETAFPLTNPALNYSELRETLMSNRVLNLSKKIDNYTAQKKKAGDISHLSVYFRNLNNGGWFGLEEKEYFSPASLMKLPILMAYIKKSE